MLSISKITIAQNDSIVVNRIDTINLVPVIDLPYFKYTKIQMGYLKKQLESYNKLSLLYEEQDMNINALKIKIKLLDKQVNSLEDKIELKNSIILRKDNIITEQEKINTHTKKYYQKKMRYSVGVGVIIGTLLTLIAVR